MWTVVFVFPWLFSPQLWRIYWKLRHSPAVILLESCSCPWRFPAVPESWQVWGWPKWKQGPWFTACPAVYNKPRQNAICLASSLFKPKENILHFILKVQFTRLESWGYFGGVERPSRASRIRVFLGQGALQLRVTRDSRANEACFSPCGNLLLSVN